MTPFHEQPLTIGVLGRPSAATGGAGIARWVGSHWTGPVTLHVRPDWRPIVDQAMRAVVLVVPGYYGRGPAADGGLGHGSRPEPDECACPRRPRRWVAVISYGGVSGGATAARRLRTELAGAGVPVSPLGLSVNTARVRDAGFGAFDELAIEALLDDAVRSVPA